MTKEFISRPTCSQVQSANNPFAPRHQTSAVQRKETSETAIANLQHSSQNSNILSRVSVEQPEPFTPRFPLQRSQEPVAEVTAETQEAQPEKIQRATNSKNWLEKVSIQPPERPSTPHFTIQPKLTVGAANDKYEREADRVARQVVEGIHSPFTASQNESSSVQRKISIQASGEGGEVSSQWEGELNRARGGGQPLSSTLKEPMERQFGTNFGGVRIHTDGKADNLARSIQAKAFTTGRDVFFRQGAYQPESRGGQELIAHELTHVVQQSGGAIQRTSLGTETEVSRTRPEQLQRQAIETRLSTKFYRRKNGSNSRKINDAIEEYNKIDENLFEERSKQIKTIDTLIAHGVATSKEESLKQLKDELLREGKDINNRRKEYIMLNYPCKTPHIVFRYDSRPISLAKAEGYVALNPEKAAITDRGENQDMVGGGRNFVGTLNYKGYAKQNAHPLTKNQWKKEGMRTFYWTAAILRKGGKTYEWLLDQIPNEEDRNEARKIVLERLEGTEKEDKRLKQILDKHGVSRNVGTTEIVTDEIKGTDILGYWEIKEPLVKDSLNETPDPKWIEVRKMTEDELNQIPLDDLERYQAFLKTKGSIQQSNVL